MTPDGFSCSLHAMGVDFFSSGAPHIVGASSVGSILVESGSLRCFWTADLLQAPPFPHGLGSKTWWLQAGNKKLPLPELLSYTVY